MPWSVILPEGEVVDVTVRRVERYGDLPERSRGGYSEAYARDRVFVGDVLAGDLFRHYAAGSKHRVEWTPISAVRNPRGLRRVDGFGSRRAAITYLLRVGGWWE